VQFASLRTIPCIDSVLALKPNLRLWEIGVAGKRHAGATLANLAVTNSNCVRLCFDNDTKSSALAARGPRHGNSPGNSNEPVTDTFTWETAG
jgi:hypothetical protein